MKTPAMLKHQQFEDGRSEKTKPRRSKRQRLDEHNNEEGNGLDADEGEIEGHRYVFLPLLPQKVSNYPSDSDEETRSLKHIVSIPRTYYSNSNNFALVFAGKKGLKAQKKSLLAV